MITKLINHPLSLLMGLISLIMISDTEITGYILAGFAESTGHTFVSSAILNIMDFLGSIMTFIFNALIEVVLWLTIILFIAHQIIKK